MFLISGDVKCGIIGDMEKPLRFRFIIGDLLITRNADSVLSDDDIVGALERHMRCDWGELDSEDWALNDAAVEVEGDRILSVYLSKGNIRFYVITEADRKNTTILLPEDY